MPLTIRHARPRAKAAAMSAAESATPSQTGGVGTRQFGSIAACQLTTRWEASSSRPANRATQCQPVKIATKPAGTTTPISGTIERVRGKPGDAHAMEVNDHRQRQPELHDGGHRDHFVDEKNKAGGQL